MDRITAIIDPNGRELVGLNVSSHIDARVLTAGVAQSHTVPPEAKSVMFSSTGDFYVNFSGMASIPSENITDGSASMLNPQLRAIGTATAISLIAPADCVVTMEFYA